MNDSKYRLAVVGADTLLGREIVDVLESAGDHIAVEKYAANGEANFGEDEGEAVFRQALEPQSVEGCDAIVSAGSAEGAARILDLARKVPDLGRIVDCTGFLEANPEARICSPLPGVECGTASIAVVAHPASAVLAHVLTELAGHQPVVRALAEVFEPASERGRLGLAELQQQTTSLLSFRPLDKAVYDAQVSFNLLPAYGENAPNSLAAVEQRIETHLATLLARTAGGARRVPPMPSLRLIQAPVFHGYSFSLWVEFESSPDVAALQRTLGSDAIDVRAAEHEVPTNVGVAGQSGVALGDIRRDRNNNHAVWIWAVADNLRLVADGVLQITAGLKGSAR